MKITSVFGRRSRRATHRNPWLRWTGWTCAYAGLALGWLLLLYLTVAYAEEAVPGTQEAMKRIALDSGTWGSLLALAIAAVVFLFGLLMRAYGKADKDKSALSLAHQTEIGELQDGFSKERAEWHAGTTLLQEARLALLREVMTALSNASTVMASVQTSINERTQTAAELSGRIQEMALALQSTRASLTDEMADVKKRLRESTEAQENLAERLRRLP